MNFGRHSMNVVHRVVKRRKKAGARSRGKLNRRLITAETFWAAGPNSEMTREPAEKERNYHFTKGYRVRSA